MAGLQDELKKQNKRKGMSDTAATAASVKDTKSDGFVDMKNKKRSKKDYAVECAPSMGEDYPYGLRLDLDDEQMTKLGMDIPNVGEEITITAKGTVERAEIRDSGDGKKKSCCIQMKKLKVG